MDRRQKERLIGASVLIMIAVIFIPMALDDSEPTRTEITVTNIPPRPQTEFSSKIHPLPGPEDGKAGAQPPAPDTIAPAQPEPATAASPQPRHEPQTTPAEAKPKAPPPAPADAGPVGLAAWVVQLGTFSSKENAEGLNRKLRAAGYASFVEPLMQGTETAFRVRVGPELRKADAERILGQLKSGMGVKEGMVVRYP